jgi:hypothetical protein
VGDSLIEVIAGTIKKGAMDGESLLEFGLTFLCALER